MKRSGLSLVLIWAGTMVGAGCDTGAPEPVVLEAPVGHPDAEGVVRISPASRPFIEVAEVGESQERVKVEAPGRVVFKDGATSEVSAPIAGRIAEVHVRVGALVTEGAPLVTLSSPEAATARAALRRARIDLRAATEELRRQRRLMERGVGIERDRFEAEIRLVEARAELSRAESAVAFLGEGNGAEVVIRAPIDGAVVERRATVGAAVEAGGSPLVVIGDTSRLWVVVDVFERELAQLSPGSDALVDLAGFSEPLPGRVVSVGAMLTAGSRRAPVYLELEPRSELPALRAGMFVRAIIYGEPLGGLAVPVSAVLIKDGLRSVAYVARDDELSFEQREIHVGESLRGRVQVLSGLSPGERIVVRGAILIDGEADELL